jgi:hypothetical protein
VGVGNSLDTSDAPVAEKKTPAATCVDGEIFYLFVFTALAFDLLFYKRGKTMSKLNYRFFVQLFEHFSSFD